MWDTTEDPVGKLINPEVKLGRNTVIYIWKDEDTGDIYVCTDNGGLNIIRTRGTPEPEDDTIEVYSRDTTPAILRWDPSNVWKDDEGNIYLGFHLRPGVTILRPDGTSISYTGERGVINTTFVAEDPLFTGEPIENAPLISSTPRIGTTYTKGWAPAAAIPLFKDENGNLYVGTDRGLTVLYYNPELRRYDRSVTYRSTGVWDTTEDPEGTLISPTPKIFTKDGFCVLHPDNTVTVYTLDYSLSPQRIQSPFSTDKLYVVSAWRDTDGDLYLSPLRNAPWKDSQGNIYYRDMIIHPDGTVTLFASTPEIFDGLRPPLIIGRIVIRGWRDSEGNVYPVTFVDTVLSEEGARMWKGPEGELYIQTSRDILIVEPSSSRVIKGSLTSDVIEVSKTPVRSISWEAEVPSGSDISIQTRTGTKEAFWIEEFGDGKLEGVSGAKGVRDIKEEDGKLVLEGVPGGSTLFFETGKPADYFPRGSIVRTRVRAEGIANWPRSVFLYTRGIYPDDYVLKVLDEGRWEVLMFRVIRKPFNRFAFRLPQCERFEIDYISVELPRGWTEWEEAKDPEGSPIPPDLDEEHPYLQWRALFSSNDISSIPVLKEVTLLPSAPSVEEEASSVPRETVLHQNYPNPFNTQTVIRYQLSEGGHVRLAVYDVVGHRVRVLEEGEFPAGY
ncbi:MAG: hypothetical protein DRI61_17595, partial [Chloroflexi bacterium]